MTTPFTVLMPVWRGDKPDRFRQALASATLQQTLPPQELVLTVDGPVPPELDAVIADVENGAYGPARVLRHDSHRGLALVLQDGLDAATTELIARADADDLCRPHRFETQIAFMDRHGIDLLGSAMEEFSDAVPVGTGPRRERPLDHDAIVAYLPRHSPFHHPTVVYRRAVAIAAGGYRDLEYLEDYWLWQRMILAGARCANLPDTLVDYRADDDMFSRRGGLRMLMSDISLQRIFLRDNTVDRRTFVGNLARRSAYRLMPGALRRWTYRRFIEPRSALIFGRDRA